MKTPAFWNTKNTFSTLLMPVAWAYDIVSTLKRQSIRSATLQIPVICVGNITVGGAGKTPVALHLGKLLKTRGINAFYLTRGYGGKLKGPALVNAQKHSAALVGDEPLLLAGILPTVVAKDRLAGALYAMQKGAQAIIMDDGFQNPSINKSLSFLVIDGHAGVGNGQLFPAGPLREPLMQALNRTHAVIAINRTTRIPTLPENKPVLQARTQPAADAPNIRGKKLFAFSGLAYPQKFFDTLSAQGALLAGAESFADHYAYTRSDIRKLMARANREGATLITTAKDAVRLPPEMHGGVAVYPIELVFENEAMLDVILDFIFKKNEAA